ncbi:MAG: LacI family DNA-binding transcriptional regulator [Phycisphaerales bacterium]
MESSGGTPEVVGVRPTLGVIAAEAGVSATTVSLVLNGRAARHRISEETRDRVVRAAKRLDYVPNDLARALRARKTGAVGVLFPHLRNDWAHEIMEGVSSVLDAEGMVALIVSHGGDPEREQAELTSLVQRRVDHLQPVGWGGAVPAGDPSSGADRVRATRKSGTSQESAWDPSAVEQPIGHLIACGRASWRTWIGGRPRGSRRAPEVYRALKAHEGVAVREDWVIRVPRGEAVGPWVSRVFGRGGSPGRGVRTTTWRSTRSMRWSGWLSARGRGGVGDGNSKLAGPVGTR